MPAPSFDRTSAKRCGLPWSQRRSPIKQEAIMKSVSQLAVVLVLAALAFAQSNEVAPNENLVAEGIPKIPVSLAESVGRYSEFRSAFFVGWHPTRREMLIETRFADTYQVHQVKFPGGARPQLTFFPDRIAGARYQPGGGDSFMFRKEKQLRAAAAMEIHRSEEHT